MDQVRILPSEALGRQFIPAGYIPEGKNEYWLRDIQLGQPSAQWRCLRAAEIEVLVKNANTCDNWDDILVTDRFDPSRVKSCEFFGLVRIGRLDNVILQHHDLRMPAGITNSRIISCDIGDNAAIHNVRYLSHYIIGNHCMLLNIDEMHCTDHAKFGNGTIKDGEDENVRVWMELVNEAGGRGVLPFDGMIPADAWLWATYREDTRLQKRFKEMTQSRFDSRRGYYGTVGAQTVIKNCGIIKDVMVGTCAYIKGANKLKNLTIRSSQQESTQIGEGVELVNGIIGSGCKIFYGSKAVRFVMGDHSNLKYGARLIHSFLGENSTVSCCEMLNTLIFPAHEQHHNNSFLTAALVKGQSNIPAGATVGSNHNSRANDGEIIAGRGFWPALCTTLKHSSRFVSYVLITKSDYPAELDIRLPFALVSNDQARDRLQVLPGYWWLYNMYALTRNAGKFSARDKRLCKTQKIEFDFLAPDTIEEIFTARELLELWTGRSFLAANGSGETSRSEAAVRRLGRELLTGEREGILGLEIAAQDMECSRRPQRIIKAAAGYRAYNQMLLYYGVKNCMEFLEADPKATLAKMNNQLAGPRLKQWENLGGQLVEQHDLRTLLSDVKQRRIDSWDALHAAYDRLWESYPAARRRHAHATLCSLLNTRSLTLEHWRRCLRSAQEIQNFICEQVYASRNKDYVNPFRSMTYRNEDEMKAVVGDIESNSFILQVRQDTAAFAARVKKLLARK